MILVFPLSRFIVGTTIGSTATIVPLSIAAAPFVARLIEGAIKEVDGGLIELSKSLGANNWEIIFKVLIPEAMPSLVHSFTITIISLIGYSAMAGAIGGGGLGDLAIRYGYQRFQTDIMIISVVVIIIIVQVIQVIGDLIVKNIKKIENKNYKEDSNEKIISFIKFISTCSSRVWKERGSKNLLRMQLQKLLK